jgi:hypothetical protein
VVHEVRAVCVCRQVGLSIPWTDCVSADRSVGVRGVGGAAWETVLLWGAVWGVGEGGLSPPFSFAVGRVRREFVSNLCRIYAN